jgi:hypothetical protein
LNIKWEGVSESRKHKTRVKYISSLFKYTVPNFIFNPSRNFLQTLVFEIFSFQLYSIFVLQKSM